jgi:hypothetical protein
VPIQQPFEQYWPAGQELSGPLQSGHSGGNIVWPGHRMQVAPPHAPLPQSVTFVQRRHFVGSAIVSVVQFGDVDGLVAMS